MLNKGHLAIVAKERSQLRHSIAWRERAAFQVVEHLVDYLKELVLVETDECGRLVGLIALEGVEHRSWNVELVLVLGVAIPQQAAAHQHVDVVGETKHAYGAQVEVARKVTEIHSVGAMQQAHAENHRLSLGDAVGVGEQSNLGRGFHEKLVTKLAIVRQLGHTVDGLQQSWQLEC